MRLKCKNAKFEYSEGLFFPKKRELKLNLTVGNTYEVEVIKEMDNSLPRGMFEGNSMLKFNYALLIFTDGKHWMTYTLPNNDINGMLTHFFHDPE